MLWFASAGWLVGGAVAGVAALVLLIRGARRVVPVSTLRFWRDSPGTGHSAGRRWVDPPWAILCAAAVTALVAAARPMWGHAARPPRVLPVRAALAKAPRQKRAELLLRLRRKAGVGGRPVTLTVHIAGNRTAEKISAAALRHGAIIPVVPRKRVVVVLQARHFAASTLRFVRQRRRFAVLVLGRAKPALVRVLAAQRGAVPGDLRLRPVAYAVGRGGDVTAAGSEIAVAAGQVALPGLKAAGPRVRFAHPMAMKPAAASPVLRHVHFAGVRVRRLLRLALSPGWQVLATAGGLPAIVMRSAPGGAAYLYFAGGLSRSGGNLARHACFVALVTNLVRLHLHRAPAAVVRWRLLASAAKAAAPQLRPIPLAPALLVLAAAAAAAATAWLARR